MSLDKIKDFLDNNGIEYIEKGKNVMAGNIGINCPFECDDPSHHLGINSKGWYSCWKDSSHSGKQFTNLIAALLNVSKYEAESLWAENEYISNTEEFYTITDKSVSENILDTKPIELPKDFRLIKKENGITQRFISYLKSRDIPDYQIYDKENPIFYSIKGIWINRFIFPILFNGLIFSWTSRSIYPDCELKYLDLSPDESARPVKHCIWKYDNLKKYNNQNILYITEGVFDCLKLNSYLPKGNQATCIFTKTLRDEQKGLLFDIAHNFKKIKIMLDADAIMEAERIRREISFFKNISIEYLPDGIKDPAELPAEYIRNFLH